MLYVDLDLPQGALLLEPGAAEDPGGIVFDAAGLVIEGDTVTGWRDRSGMRLARPSKPNEGHARQETLGARPVLRLRDGVNCGFAHEELLLDQPRFSVAVVFASPLGRAGTLMTLNPREGRDYLFLTESDGVVELKFRDGVAGLTRPCPLSEGRFTLVCASVEGGKMKLAVNGETPGGLAVPSGLESGFHDLFIGCRSDRAGIVKTLGEAQIARLWIWAGEDVFAGERYDKLIACWQKEAAYGI
ncbi:hypothetical protein [Celeribacter persicus]|uniref:Concanavalin A-like lectin/glucanase superfamily protein n=1 Tax=Celeribacter persicus TaxID=1651082 RepID=A0A2T5HS46_9RHOB|nr:hypothetical protein [Celeribacter persicus]PTQ74391.1 hypothetical protein C8N42_10435 [Celeribacter persicus]